MAAAPDSPPPPGEDDGRRRKRHGMLKLYYGLQAESGNKGTTATTDPCDINGAHFKPEVYLQRLMQEKSLNELMDKERDMVRQIRSLDSDMQTLVYENYNKFISATDTIRKMKNDFKKMEDEMDRLATNMESITEFSARISGTLQDRRQQITKLSGVHMLLKKLQFLFELPARLKKCIEMQAYGQAVRYYTKARTVLDQYQHMPSFHGIREDCSVIVAELCVKLREQFKNKESDAHQLAECVDLLLQLKEPADELCDEFLLHARHKVDEDLEMLRLQLRMLEEGQVPSPGDPGDGDKPHPMDVLEFTDTGCNVFLSDMCLVIASYKDLFINRPGTGVQEQAYLEKVANQKLEVFVNSLMGQYFSYVEQRVQLEKESSDNTLLVRALDRFHRRLQAVEKLLPETESTSSATGIVAKMAHDRVIHYSEALRRHFADCLTDVRQSLAASRSLSKQEGSNLGDLLQTTATSILDQLKTVLSDLRAFIESDITFAMQPYFREPFCVQDVREGLVVGFLKHMFTACSEFCEGSGDKSSAPPPLILLLSRLCLDYDMTTISYLISLTDEQFLVEDKSAVTPLSELCNLAKDTAQKLLDHYVKVQGLTISQMLRKSVETRDWLNTIEPRNVRAVMKRVVEDVTAIDSQVGLLYEEGLRKAHSSDSSKRTFPYSSSRQNQRSQWSSYAPSSNMDTSLMSNIQKLFSERIEIFSAVDFSKVSVLTGIIKISLKTFLECVRLRTFARFGLQQIQVDCHYLQMYLWRFVSDENLVHTLLDEIVGSAIHRCLDPITMEPSVIEVICDRG
ncbi:vacuolar protein sorting-associated protein 51 homolog [Branchiostoma floridae x Branchiostoma japonicum]